MPLKTARLRHSSPGEGSLKQRADGLWVARLYLGPDENGKPVTWQKASKDRDVVEKALREATKRHRQGRDVGSDQQTVKELLLAWLETVRDTREHKTFTSYAQVANDYVIPYLGSVRLVELTPAHVQTMLTRLAQREPPLSPRTRKYARDVLSYALGRAVKWEVIDRNVARLADPPKVPRSKIVPLTEDEARQLLDVVKGHPLEALYSVALAVAVRQGEALGLRWSDVDFNRGQVTIQVALTVVDGEYRLKEVKTGERGRVLALPRVAMKALEERRRIQQEERRGAGFGWKGNKLDLVFTTSVGTPLDRWNVRRQFQMFLSRAGLPHKRFYDLRHTSASLLLAQGVPLKVISEILGHASIRTTADVYTHLTTAQHRDAAEKMSSILSAG